MSEDRARRFRAGDFDPFYQAPILDVDSFDWAIEQPVILADEVDNGPQLLSYYSAMGSDTLFVAFHGAIRLEVDRYPRFDRVGTSARLGRSLLAFADPTLTLDPKLRLCWYLGGERWDPITQIVSTISRALDSSGAKRLVLLGGSGGGFAAMRVGAHFPSALVFAFSPQTAIRDYIPKVVTEYFNSCFPGRDPEEIVQQDPHRFSMRELYAALDGHGPALYLLQSLRDPSHLHGHYAPMKAALGVSQLCGTSAGGTARFVAYEASREGHGPPSATEFEEHLSLALEFHETVQAVRKEW